MQVVPPIVIAEDRPGAERRRKPRQLRRPDRIGHLREGEAVRGDEVAEQQHDVGLQRARPIDNAADVFELHVGTAGVQIGDHGDGELAARRPARQSRRIARDDEAVGLDGGGIDRGPRRQSKQSHRAGQHAAARDARLGGGRRPSCGCWRDVGFHGRLIACK